MAFVRRSNVRLGPSSEQEVGYSVWRWLRARGVVVLEFSAQPAAAPPRRQVGPDRRRGGRSGRAGRGGAGPSQDHRRAGRDATGVVGGPTLSGQSPHPGRQPAACLVITAPDPLRGEAAFARLCGVAPIPASSGKTSRHRLSRGGNRDANRALYMLAVSRLRSTLMSPGGPAKARPPLRSSGVSNAIWLVRPTTRSCSGFHRCRSFAPHGGGMSRTARVWAKRWKPSAWAIPTEGRLACNVRYCTTPPAASP
jgi:hypothetical protein